MWLPFVCFFCLCLYLADLFLFFVSYVSLPGDDVLCWLLSCPLLSV